MAKAKMEAQASSIKIKLVKSLSGRNTKHIATAHSLGLNKTGKEVEHVMNDALKGKISQISYLIQTSEV